MSDDEPRMRPQEGVIKADGAILITGAAGFVGPSLTRQLVSMGFTNLRLLVRDAGRLRHLGPVLQACADRARLQLVTGDLLSRESCWRAADGVEVVYHLAVGGGDKSFSNAFMNAVVTTRNLLDVCLERSRLRRFVNVSSLAVYTNRLAKPGGVLDEDCPVDESPALRGEAYCFAKVKQDELVQDYGRRHRIPYVIVRPGVVYGPGKAGIPSRVGIGTFGLFLHLGGSNRIPLTYVENCAAAIALAGVKPGIDGETFNVVDDQLPTSRQFLRHYKRKVARFPSVYLPHWASLSLCTLWEKYSKWSEGQLPPAFNRRSWHAYWKGSKYSNAKAKRLLGWVPRVTMSEGLEKFFQACREGEKHA